MVQRVTFSKTNTDAWSSEEVAFAFTDLRGASQSTARIQQVASAAGASNLEKALLELPGFALRGVTVSQASASATQVQYLVTFNAPLAPGNQHLLNCPAAGGCSHPGCQPKYAGLIALDPSTSTSVVAMTAGVALQRGTTAASAAGNSDIWAQVECSSSTSDAGDTGNVVFRFREQADTDSAGISAAWSPWAPVPYGPASLGVPLGAHGLLVDFLDSSTAPTCADGVYEFAWSLASCSVDTDGDGQSAGVHNEATECSRRGVCDRSTGMCKCFQGYRGEACSSMDAAAI